MKRTMPTSNCVIESCKTSIRNKPPGISFHSLPTSNEMRNRWLKLLWNKCTMVDWYGSKICSKHFEPKYFDSRRKLKDNAIPTIFSTSNATIQKIIKKTPEPKSRIDILLTKLTQAELTADIKNSKIKELKSDFDSFVTDDLKCKPDAPPEAQLWLMVKKQEHLNNRLKELVSQTNKHVEVLESNLEEANNSKKENEQTIESLKYIVKCLQEKHATLEEQIEILTAVESR